MLTSCNQYIRPEYLSPISTTFDSKTSPLALLAQTCSAIGSDSPNPKLLANIEKSTKCNLEKLSPGTLSSGSSNDTPKSSFKPYDPSSLDHDQTKPPDDSQHTRARDKSPERSTSASNHQLQNLRCESNQSAASSRASPLILNRGTEQQECSNTPNCVTFKDSMNTQSMDPTRLKVSLESIAKNPSRNSDINLKVSASAPALTTTTVGSPYFSGYSSYPIDLITTSALMSPHHQMVKAAALSSYFNYTKMKIPGALDSMILVCRDPYCTGCALSSHMLGKLGTSGCPVGCSQCDHPESKSYSHTAPATLFSTNQSSAAMYAHAQLTALAAASKLPYVCNWIGSDSSYCGKRFAASEELFQHLRTQHAADFSMSEALLNPATTAVGLTPSLPFFQRNYPASPLSPMSTTRYHPYGKPSLLPPSMPPASPAGIPMPPHPLLAQYFPPYSFYGARLNGSNNMHP